MPADLLIFFLITWASSFAAPRHHFPDAKQEKYVQNLKDFEVVVPEKVSRDGSFVTFDLHHRVRRSTDVIRGEEDNVHYRLRVGGKHLHVSLKPNDAFISPGFVVERRRSSPSISNYSSSSSLNDVISINRWTGEHHCHLVGYVANQTKESNMAAISTCHGLTGYFLADNEEYFIEPIRGLDRSSNSLHHHPHVVYKRSALPPEVVVQAGHSSNSGGSCGTHADLDDSNDYRRILRRREKWQKRHDEKMAKITKGKKKKVKRSVSSERNVETLVVADKMMVDYYSNDDIENYILTVINMVSSLYRDATIGNAINVVLVRLLLLEDMQQEESLNITHHADNSLRSFCKWQKSINPKDDKHPNHHDVAILLTRYNICARVNEPCSTLGLAEVAGMCQPHRSCNINEDTGLALAYTVAHEIGHNFGMNHDGPHNGCEAPFRERQHVMAPHVNSDSTPIVWSKCSRNEITKFLDRDWGTCLDDEPSDHEFQFPEALPGMMYDVGHQCRLQNGPDTTYCDVMEQDHCNVLWCKKDNRCITRLEAAAPGTSCGQHKWCFNGECTIMGDRPEAIDGEWGPWGAWSSCSRSCGAGIESSDRFCDSPQPASGGRYCIGERRRYRVCNSQPCPDGVPGFRAVQCTRFNDVPYKDELFTWNPVSVQSTPCQLHCKPEGQFFSVMLSDTVDDGTSCNPGTRDMCINGKCRKVACDWGIDSDAQEDRCGVCHGDGTQCQTIRGEFIQKDGIGYVHAVTVPAGSRNIRVEEIAEASNYLALRGEKPDNFYLNGNWFIQWSGEYDAAGSVIYYTREGELETIHLPGPTKEELHFMILYQTKNPGLKYEYTIPDLNVTRKPEFHWENMDWTVCTVTCGGGVQTSSARCVEVEAGIVDDAYCVSREKLPDVTRICNRHQCPSRWWMGPWQHCSVTCGQNGVRRRTVICVRSLGPDEEVALHDSDCNEDDKPSEQEACHHKQPCPGEIFWQTGNWTDTCQDDPCNSQTRTVMCSIPGGPCDDSVKPSAYRRCGEISCGVWVTGNWSECSKSCGDGVQFRRVSCEGGLKCQDAKEPTDIQKCNNANCHVQVKDEEVLVTTAKTDSTESDNNVYESSGNDSLDEDNPSLNSIIIDENESAEIKTKTKDSGADGIGNDDISVEVTVKNTDKVETLGDVGDRKRKLKRPHEIAVDKVEPKSFKEIKLEGDDYRHKYDVVHGTPPNHNEENQLFVVHDANTNVKDKYPIADDVSFKLINDDEKNRPDHHRHWKHRIHNKHKPEDNLHVYSDDPSVEDEKVHTLDIRPQFEWKTGEWTECSRKCSGGHKRRDVSCYEENTKTLVDNGLCDSLQQPNLSDVCNVEPCLEWQLDEWSHCSASCDTGVKTRQVWCPDQGLCNPDSRPKDWMLCVQQPCVHWVAGPWSQCPVTCGGSYQLRHVQCVNQTSLQPAAGCDSQSKPFHKQSCNVQDCPSMTAAKQTSCRNKLDTSLCVSLSHLCTAWYFKVKCCETCSKSRNASSVNPAVWRSPLSKS